MMSARPNHFEPGKRTPAERRGEAHPMIPSGGIAVSRMHSGTENAALPRPRVKSKPQGNASRAAAARAEEQSNERSALDSKESARSGDERPACRRVVAEHRSIGVLSGFRVIDKQRSDKGKRDCREVAAPRNRRRRGGNGGKRNATAEELP